jgi:hypothetical protein
MLTFETLVPQHISELWEERAEKSCSFWLWVQLAIGFLPWLLLFIALNTETIASEIERRRANRGGEARVS